MEEIIFNRNYDKLHGQTEAVLIGLTEINVPEDISDEFVQYDTAVNGRNIISQFDEGTYLQLFFVGNKHIPFCTLRNRTGYKGFNRKEYYLDHIGSLFKIVIDKE